MSERNRGHQRFFVTLGACIGVMLVLTGLFALGQYQADYANRQDERASRHAEHADGKCYTVGGLVFCVGNDEAAKADAERAEDDLQAQENMAEWAKWITLFTALQIVVGGVGIWFVKRTFDKTGEAVAAAQDANRIARESSEQQLRAYVQVDIAGLEIITPSELKVVTLQRNTGATPAYKVVGAMRQFYCPLPITNEHLDEMMMQVSQEPPSQAEIAIGPDTSRSYYKHVKPIEPRLSEAHKAALAGESAIVACGFVSYDDTFKKRHTTQFLHIYTLAAGKWSGTYAGRGNSAD